MGDRPIVGQIIFVKVTLFRRGLTEQVLNWSWKTSVLRDMFIMVVKVGKSADEHCLRRQVGMGSRSQNVLDGWELIFNTSLVTWDKTMRLVGVYRGGVGGDENLEDFNAVCNFWILSQKKVVNVFESNLKEATGGSGDVGLRSKRVLIVFQILWGLSELGETK